ncbi:MAG: VCBS repeat-containing protein [Nannocystaceae bacterium]
MSTTTRRIVTWIALGSALSLPLAACGEADPRGLFCARLGRLCEAPGVRVELAFTPTAGASADLDHDGDRDLVVAGRGHLYLQHGPVGDDPFLVTTPGDVDVRIADLDGDGDEEILASTSDPPRLHVFEDAIADVLGAPRSRALDAAPRALWVGPLVDGGPPRIVATTATPAGLLVADADLETIGAVEFGELPGALAAADLDGDGAIDLAVVDFAGARVHALRGDGQGGFTVIASVASAPLPEAIDLADIDGDGRRDALVHGGASAAVWLHRGDGAGGFAEGVEVDVIGSAPVALGVVGVDGVDGAPGWIVGASSRSIVAAQIDDAGAVVRRAFGGYSYNTARVRRDGDHLFTAHLGGAEWSRLEAAPGFVEFARWPAIEAEAIAAGDLDVDGLPELAVATSDALTIFTAVGDDAWIEGARVPLTAPVDHLVIAEVTGDGHVDVILAESEPEPALQVALGDGAGGLALGEPSPVDLVPSWITAIGVDADGRRDLAFAPRFLVDSGARVVRFDDAGRVAERAPVLEDAWVGRLAAADVDLDGRDELVAWLFGPGDPRLVVLHALPQGGWGPAESLSLSDHVDPSEDYALVIGDLDLDGTVDAALSGPGTILVHDLGALDPTAIERLDHDDLSAKDGVVADLDGDGRPDLLFGGYASTEALLAPGFGAPEVVDGSRSAGPITAFRTPSSGGRLVAGAGEGLGVLRLGVTPSLAVDDQTWGPAGGTRARSSDLDGDGHLDLVVAGRLDLAVLWGPLDGDLVQGVDARTALGGEALALVDLDGDGRDEIASAGRFGLVVSRTDAERSLGRRLRRSVAGDHEAPAAGRPGLNALAVADLDGDGFADSQPAASASRADRRHGSSLGPDATSTFSFRMDPAHETASFHLADLDGDGLADPIAVDPRGFTRWSTAPRSP